MSVIKSFSVGNGDMFYIKHDTDNFTIIDCNLIDDVKDDILDEIDNQRKEKEFNVLLQHIPMMTISIV